MGPLQAASTARLLYLPTIKQVKQRQVERDGPLETPLASAAAGFISSGGGYYLMAA